ncbi:LAQU0S13e01156g1_1 [Lachancea quebecensis]|uniref:LAQU0S13e01156g1_1 n=1 Tax=Lachancea quebecensis TaxID=1654605 RepID=A0A0P1KVK9_9SACH|nr:LAQU0S13e01156g1_1 [Lachancea quebecensis]
MGREYVQKSGLIGHRAFHGLLKRGSSKDSLKTNNASKGYRKWWKRSPKSSKPNSNYGSGHRIIYGADLSLVGALALCFAMLMLLLMVKEVGLTTRHCAKWEFWTLLASGGRSSVVRLARNVGFRILQIV